jgi:hypothetical protein
LSAAFKSLIAAIIAVFQFDISVTPLLCSEVTRKGGFPVYKVELPGGFMVHVENLDQVRELVQNFSSNGSNTRTATAPAAAAIAEGPDPAPVMPPAPKKTPKGAVFAPTEVKIRSVSTTEAMFKLFKGLDNATHTDALRFLASKGEKGAGVEEIKEALKLPEKYKLGGLTAAIRRRAPHYGLEPEQVLIVEYRGIVANVRILDYRLGPEMLEMMETNGLLWKPKDKKEPKSRQE